MILACLLGGILISGVLSRAVLTGIELKFDMPEHIFAEQPVLAEIELRNEKQAWPSFSLLVVGQAKRNKTAAEILTRPVFFPYIPHMSASRQKVELRFPRRGVYRQDAFGIRTRFPFGFFEKTREVDSDIEIVVYPRVEPTDQFYEVLPLLSGEMASYFRGRGHELHSLREYLPTDSARFVDWKVTAQAWPHGGARIRARGRAPRDARARSLHRAAAPRSRRSGRRRACRAFRARRLDGRVHRLALPRDSLGDAVPHAIDFITPMAPAGEIIYDTLRELALLEPQTSATGGAFLDELVNEREIFKIILTARPQRTIPTALWSSSYFLFIDQL